jgi:hypothetical protein
MSRKTLRFPGSLFLLFSFLVPAATLTSAAADPRAAAIVTAKKQAAGCKECFFFALPTRNPLIKKHELYVVSTLDRLPPPFWTVAVPKRGDPLVLNAAHFEDWNLLIGAERLSLQQDADVEAYVKAYLDLAVGRALLVERLLPADLAAVRKNTPTASDQSLQIVRGKQVLSVSFYAKDIMGTLERWDLSLTPDGKILRAEKR